MASPRRARDLDDEIGPVVAIHLDEAGTCTLDGEAGGHRRHSGRQQVQNVLAGSDAVAAKARSDSGNVSSQLAVVDPSRWRTGGRSVGRHSRPLPDALIEK